MALSGSDKAPPPKQIIHDYSLHINQVLENISSQGCVANSTPGIFQWNLPEYSGLENMPKVANMANMENMILVL